MPILVKHGANTNSTGIGINVKRPLKIRKGQDWSSAQGGLKSSKSLLLGRCPNEWCILLEKLSQGLCNDAKMSDKFAVITCQAQESAKGTNRCRSWPVLDSLHFGRVCSDAIGAEHMPEIGN